MKEAMKLCENCKEETRHRNKIHKASKGRSTGHYVKRDVSKCCECGKTIIKNTRQRNTYTKRLGGNPHKK